MKLHLLALILIWSATQKPQTAGGTIGGRVLRAATVGPIPNTPVTLISSSGLLDQMSQMDTL